MLDTIIFWRRYQPSTCQQGKVLRGDYRDKMTAVEIIVDKHDIEKQDRYSTLWTSVRFITVKINRRRLRKCYIVYTLHYNFIKMAQWILICYLLWMETPSNNYKYFNSYWVSMIDCLKLETKKTMSIFEGFHSLNFLFLTSFRFHHICMISASAFFNFNTVQGRETCFLYTDQFQLRVE